MNLGNNWHSYLALIPEKKALCIFYRESYGGISSEKAGEWVGYAKDFPPEFNVSNLYWRYTGIGREQLGWPDRGKLYDYPEKSMRQQANMDWTRTLVGSLGGCAGSSASLLGNCNLTL